MLNRVGEIRFYSRLFVNTIVSRLLITYIKKKKILYMYQVFLYFELSTFLVQCCPLETKKRNYISPTEFILFWEKVIKLEKDFCTVIKLQWVYIILFISCNQFLSVDFVWNIILLHLCYKFVVFCLFYWLIKSSNFVDN